MLAIGWLAWMAAHASELREEKIAHAGVQFRVVRVSPERVELVWRDEQGKPYQTFDRVQRDYEKRGAVVRFLTNAGIYEPGWAPSGLHIEQGQSLQPLQRGTGNGNFFLQPNGVVARWQGGESRCFVGTKEAWDRQLATGARPRWANQSGPMLLVHGKRHPSFRPHSASRLLRNGVGVDGAQRLVFAITARGEEVNFWDFAGLFLHLGCRDALFLDGDISQMEVNPRRPVRSNRFAAMFVVAEP